MDQQQQSRWRPTGRQLLWAGGVAALAFLIIVVCGYLFSWKWTGLPKRTLWDWLDLLIIPVVLAIGGYLFTRSENRATRVAAEQQAQDEALQAYLDQMGQLLLDKEMPLRQSKEGDEVRTLARARTLKLLSRLDGERKGRIVHFLYESDLIAKHRAVLHLSGANLREASLVQASLSLANLSRADLSGADLSAAFDYLRHDVLRRAVFLVRPANLTGAYLRRAKLSRADLRHADLEGAKGIALQELEQAALSLEGATMPNGQEYEDWLKSRGEVGG